MYKSMWTNEYKWIQLYFIILWADFQKLRRWFLYDVIFTDHILIDLVDYFQTSGVDGLASVCPSLWLVSWQPWLGTWRQALAAPWGLRIQWLQSHLLPWEPVFQVRGLMRLFSLLSNTQMLSFSVWHHFSCTLLHVKPQTTDRLWHYNHVWRNCIHQFRTNLILPFWTQSFCNCKT